MMSVAGTRAVSLVVAIAAAWNSGCAAWRPPKPPIEDVAAERKKNKAEISDDFEQRRNQAQFLAASFQWQQGEPDNCRESLRQLLTRDPAHRDGCLLWAEVCLCDGCPETALPLIESLAAARPDDAEIAGILVELRSHEEGVKNVGNDGRPVFYEEAVLCAAEALRQNDTTQAIRILSSVEDQAAESPDIHRLLGLAYYRRGDYTAARDALSRSIALDKTCALSYFLMGSTLARLGDAEAAQWHLSRAGELDARFAASR